MWVQYYILHMRFGEHLTALREARGLSIRKLAKIVGVDSTYLSRVESGKYEPPGETIMAGLAAALDEDLDVLLGLAGKVSAELQQIIALRPRKFADLIRQLKNAPDRVIEGMARKVRDGEW